MKNETTKETAQAATATEFAEGLAKFRAERERLLELQKAAAAACNRLATELEGLACELARYTPRSPFVGAAQAANLDLFAEMIRRTARTATVAVEDAGDMLRHLAYRGERLQHGEAADGNEQEARRTKK